ncbi:MAG: Fe3+-siderophore ABC transporter permease [Methanomassiliicoccales archaeon Mx-03]|nr:MAG: Fe3+-siderophore ABC transporter permease [Methanomassiliicoccales archaeon Mx-03]
MNRIRGWLAKDVGTRRETQSLDAIEQNDMLFREYASDVAREDGSVRQEYRRFTVRKFLFILVSIVGLIITAGVVITYGSFDLSITEVYTILWNHLINGRPEDPVEYLTDSAVWDIRLPRVLVGIIAGFGLALAGTVMQSTLKNPMADSYTTGVSSGASFGATVTIVMGVTFVSYEFSLVFSAFIFSLMPTLLIVIISRVKTMSSTSMILAGLAVMYIFSALTSALRLMGDPDAIAALYRWQVGSLNNMTWDDVPVMFVVTMAGSIVIMFLSKKINLLATGDDNAKSLGINASQLRVLCLIAVSLITAAIVSFTGTIGFIGLVAPHVARIFVGSDNRFLVPASAFFGSLLMLVSDYLGRTLFAPTVLEVGVVTAFIGGPLFLYLIMRQRKEVWS